MLSYGNFISNGKISKLKHVVLIQFALMMIFYGISILLYGNTFWHTPLISALFVIIILFLSPVKSEIPRKKVYVSGALNQLVYTFIFLIIIFYILKYQLYGVPAFSQSVSIFRVEFARHLAIPSDIIKFGSFIIISLIIIYKLNRAALFILLLTLTIINFLNGFRSAIVDPFIVLLIAHLVSGGRINFRTIILISLVSFLLFTLLIYATVIRGGIPLSELNLAIETLVRRLFYVNYLNIERVANIYELSLLGASYWWDFQSLLGIRMGFNGTTTMLSGFADYQNYTMTPTLFGETLANFGVIGTQILFMCLPIFLVLLLIIYRKIDSNIYLLKSTFVVFIFSFIRYMQPHGIGSFLFSHSVKLLVSAIFIAVLFVIIRILSSPIDVNTNNILEIK